MMGSNEIVSNSLVPSTINELFAAHYERLVRALTVVAGDRESAADAVQEAFVKAHLRWRKLRDYDDPIGWVRRVVINQLRDEHRRAGRKQRALTRLAGRTETTTTSAEIDEFDRLLAQLPKQQRAATATSAPSTSGVETTVVTTIDPVVTSSVEPTSVDVSVSTSVADASSTVPNTTIDDNDDADDVTDADDGADVSTTSSSPENTAASSSTSVPARAAFTKTYQSAGGSITVTWNGSVLSLDAVSPSAGFEAEIDDQASDRVRVEFDNGDADWRIEVRFDDGAIRERTTN